MHHEQIRIATEECVPDDQKRWLARVRAWASDAQTVLENAAKVFLVVAILVSMAYFGHAADPGRTHPYADRILSWSFAVFAVGLAELFVLFVILSVIGKIDLAQAFYDKPVGEETAAATAEAEQLDKTATKARARQPGAAKEEVSTPVPVATPPVSLARLQAFLWTLLVMTIYFHRVVKDGSNGLPAIPPELLMVMGISGATYLISKGISASAPTEKAKSGAKAEEEPKPGAASKAEPKPGAGGEQDRKSDPASKKELKSSVEADEERNSEPPSKAEPRSSARAGAEKMEPSPTESTDTPKPEPVAPKR